MTWLIQNINFYIGGSALGLASKAQSFFVNLQTSCLIVSTIEQPIQTELRSLVVEAFIMASTRLIAAKFAS